MLTKSLDKRTTSSFFPTGAAQSIFLTPSNRPVERFIRSSRNRQDDILRRIHLRPANLSNITEIDDEYTPHFEKVLRKFLLQRTQRSSEDILLIAPFSGKRQFHYITDSKRKKGLRPQRISSPFLILRNVLLRSILLRSILLRNRRPRRRRTLYWTDHRDSFRPSILFRTPLQGNNGYFFSLCLIA